MKNNVTGLTFNYADIVDFRKKVGYMFNHPDVAKQMGEAGFKDIVTVYSPQQHYEQLMALFDKVTNQIRK